MNKKWIIRGILLAVSVIVVGVFFINPPIVQDQIAGVISFFEINVLKIGIAIGALMLLIIAFFVAVYNLAQEDMWFTFVPEGDIKFLQRGEDLDKYDPLWVNVEGYHLILEDKQYDGEQHYKIVSDQEHQDGDGTKNILDENWNLNWFTKLLWDLFGIRFISFVYPSRRIAEFEISKAKLRDSTELKDNAPLKDWIRPGKGTVDSLRFRFQHPVYIDNVELAGDNSQIDVIIQTTWRVVYPTIPVFFYKGDFFPLLDTAIKAAFVDYCSSKVDQKGNFSEEGNHLSLDTFRKINKGKGSGISNYLRSLNGASAKNIPDELKEIAPVDVVKAFGFYLEEAWTFDYEPDESTLALAEALRQKEIKKAEAEGVREEAYGARDATMARGQGDSTRLTALIDALVEKGVDKNVAAQMVAEIEKSNAYGSKDSNLQTLIERGAINVNLGGK